MATPISFVFINKLTNLQGDMLVHTDRRIALVNQLLAGMKSLKMYAWEAAQEARVRLSYKPSLIYQQTRISKHVHASPSCWEIVRASLRPCIGSEKILDLVRPGSHCSWSF